MLKSNMQLRVKDLSTVPMWWLEWDSNLRPSGRKTLNLPLSHHEKLQFVMNQVRKNCLAIEILSCGEEARTGRKPARMGWG